MAWCYTCGDDFKRSKFAQTNVCLKGHYCKQTRGLPSVKVHAARIKAASASEACFFGNWCHCSRQPCREPDSNVSGSSAEGGNGTRRFRIEGGAP